MSQNECPRILPVRPARTAIRGRARGVLLLELSGLALSGCLLEVRPLEDQDQDAYSISEDCDDQDPSVGPAYRDDDRDGYGSGDALAGCGRGEEGYTERGGDCDDRNSSIHPGAVEACDGTDADCDGSDCDAQGRRP